MEIVIRCSIWYHLHNIENVKNAHGGVLLLVELQAEGCNFTKSSTPPGVIFTWANCTKSRQVSHYTLKIKSSQYFNRLFSLHKVS